MTKPLDNKQPLKQTVVVEVYFDVPANQYRYIQDRLSHLQELLVDYGMGHYRILDYDPEYKALRKDKS